MADASPPTASAPVSPPEGARPAASSPATPPQDGSRVAAYDFRNPAFLAEADLRRLRLLHEDFARYLGARLSLHLRMEFGLKVAGLTTESYAKFCGDLPNPTHLALFKAEPLSGTGIVGLNPHLALAMADRLLGGRGQPTRVDRLLTEIETALIEDVLIVLLGEWGAQWKSEPPLCPQVIGHENNGRFLQTSPKDATVLALTLECRFGDCAEQIRIGVPYYTIEPLVKKLQARRPRDSARTPAARRSEWQPAFDGIALPVRAEWQALELSVREISSLRVGDVVEMPPNLCHETRVLLNGTPKFIGTVGLETDRVAVQLTRQLTAAESPHAQPDGRKVP